MVCIALLPSKIASNCLTQIPSFDGENGAHLWCSVGKGNNWKLKSYLRTEAKFRFSLAGCSPLMFVSLCTYQYVSTFFFLRKTFHSITNPFECRSTRQSSRNAAKKKRASNKMAQRKKELYRWPNPKRIEWQRQRRCDGVYRICPVACDRWQTEKKMSSLKFKIHLGENFLANITANTQSSHESMDFPALDRLFYLAQIHTNNMYKAAAKLQTQQCLFYDLSSFRAMFPSSQPFGFALVWFSAQFLLLSF